MVFNKILIVLNLLILTNSYNQHSSNEINYITYTKTFQTDNDVTGTGNKLKDIIYIAKCKMMNCPNRCCEDSLDNMRCGNTENCNEYRLKNQRREISLLIVYCVLPYVFIPLLWLLILFTDKDKYPNLYKRIYKFFIIFSGVIIPPYGILILYDYLKNYNQSKDEENNPSYMNTFPETELFHNKEFRESDFNQEKSQIFNVKNNKIKNVEKELLDINKNQIMPDVSLFDNVICRDEIQIDFKNFEISEKNEDRNSDS